MAIVVLIIAALSLFVPATSLWIELSWINYLLMVVMFGMGLTLKFSDFEEVFKRPGEVLLGCAAQFMIMPALAYALGMAFSLPPALLVGVVLVGTCPGGTASNVVTYLAKGDVPLSVAMTSVNTLLASFLTPALAYLILRTTIEVNVVSMFMMIAQVVLVPIALGLLVTRVWGKFTAKISGATPYVSIAAICLIVASVVSHNAKELLTTSRIVFIVVILHNLLGCLVGFAVGRILRINPAKVKALSIEVGMQNSGLATILANNFFPTEPLAAVPGALFSVWHNISGTILAELYKRWTNSGADKPREESIHAQRAPAHDVKPSNDRDKK